MKFGVFDHMDRASGTLTAQYEDRLALISAYDQAGFHMYHLAEHHATPLGMSPSPSLFMAAVAQRTTRIHFGPLVYPLALYHPLRLVEEICMLDHMSGGRFEFGVGRGASPHELAIYGIDTSDGGQGRFAEALAVVMQALTCDRLDFAGEHYNFTDVPMEMKPLQRPHPPMWYGVSRPEGAALAAERRFNVVANLPSARARPILDRFRTAWHETGGAPEAVPLHGFSRFVVIAESDEEAAVIADRAYRRWNASFWLLWEKRGGRPNLAYYPDSFAEAEQQGYGVAGTVETVRRAIQAQVAEAGGNYLVCRFAFGDLTLAESLRSLKYFTEGVMPALIAAVGE